MSESKIENVQPEQQHNSEQKAEVPTSSPSIANANVVCSQVSDQWMPNFGFDYDLTKQTFIRTISNYRF